MAHFLTRGPAPRELIELQWWRELGCDPNTVQTSRLLRFMTCKAQEQSNGK